MPYTPTTWANQITALNATHMNNIESGVDAAPYGPDASSGDVAIADGIGGWTYSPLTLNGIGVPTGNVNMNSFGFTNLVSASADTTLTLNSGAGGASGDLIFQTNATEQARITFSAGATGGNLQVGNLSTNITAGTNGSKVLAQANVIAPGSVSTTHTAGFQSIARIKGMSRSGPTDQFSAFSAQVNDASSVVSVAISGMSRSGTTMTVTTSTAHGFTTGDSIGIYGVTHSFNAEINGQFVVASTPLTTTFTVTLAGLSSGSYGSGGHATNRGTWYGYYFATTPLAARGGLTGTAAHGDDIGAFVTYNGDSTGTYVAGDNIYIAHNTAFVGGASEWFTGLSVAANVDYGVTLTGTINTAGIDLSTATLAAAGTPAIFLPNMGHVTGLGADGVTRYPLFRLNASNHMELRAALELNDSVNINFGTSTGTIIAPTTSQKFAFWGATPIARPSGTQELFTSLNAIGLIPSGATPITTTGAVSVGSLALTAQAGNVVMNSHKITGLAAATANGDAIGWPWPLIGGLLDVQVFGPGANQTWANPNVGTVAVGFVKGGGGGGGGGVNSASAGNPRSGGAGGGGGGWVTFAVPLSALGSTCNVNVASGGAGGTAGVAGSDANRTTAFDSAGGNANVTAATGGAAGTSGASAGGTGGVASAPTYAGYSVTSTATNGGAGGAGTTAASAGANGSPNNGGGAGGGCSTTPTGQNGGAGQTASFTVGTGGVGGVGGTSGALTQGAPSLSNPFAVKMEQSCGGSGGGGCHTNGNGAARGANGYNGGGGGGGGSCVNGAAGLGGNGGDGCVVVLVY